ncbi:MAG: hypothetical protein QOH81_1108 [Sphingomonadales bacterium]|jgi:hypothetical protein|nr:hypothetical protein [Sphingomonadales bacterium]
MAIQDDAARLRRERINATGRPHTDALQGVDKERVRAVLGALDLGGNADLVDCVFALLDNETPSWFPKAPKGATFADGASTAHLACHIGVLQRGKTKLDREGRDYWIKPLRDLGGFEAVTLLGDAFVPGHVKAKSPNSAYRLAESFVAILQAPAGEWRGLLAAWAAKDAARERLTFQAEMAAASRSLVDSGHAELIAASVQHYAPRFLRGYRVLYVDDSDGDRISPKERAAMEEAGAMLTLDDPMPDVLLWHPETDWLWVIEAVTSDGEVDAHKVTGMQRFAERCGKAGVGFTTTYRTWKEASARQGTHRNIAVGTYIWIQADPAKQLRVESIAAAGEN